LSSGTFGVIQVALEVVLQLGSEGGSVLLNELSRDKWEIIVFISFPGGLSKMFFIFIFRLDLPIIVHEIAINGLFTGSRSMMLQVIKLSDVVQELQLLFLLVLLVILLLTELISHLAQMFFHHSIACKLLLIVHSLAEFHDVGWVNNTFELAIA